MARCYVRNGVWGWTVEAQEKALAEADVLDPETLYRDVLPAHMVKRPSQVHADWLVQRVALLKPTARRGSEDIAVATLTALGVNEADLADALVKAAARNAFVMAYDSGFLFGPKDGPDSIVLAIRDWQRAKRSGQTKPGRLIGNRAAAEAKKAKTLAKLPEARKLWRLPSKDMPTMEVAARVGLSVKTLYSYLGRREVAQRRRKSK